MDWLGETNLAFWTVVGAVVAALSGPLGEMWGVPRADLAVVDDGDGPGRATLYNKFGSTMSHRVIFDATAPRLPGFFVTTPFTF